MQIVFHIGAHCTDDGHILSCLAKNKGQLADEGILIADPDRFRPVIRDTLNILQGERASQETQNQILHAVLDEGQPQRIIFSNTAFLSGIQRAVTPTGLYPDAADKCRRLFNLFPESAVEFCLAIRNPATFLPACFARSKNKNFAAFFAQLDPGRLLWSEMVARMQAALPESQIKVWSNEDTPFVWHELIREIADCDQRTRLTGLDDYLKSIMMPEGLDRMETYLKTHPPANEMQRRRVVSAFLDKFEIEDEALDVEAANWTEEVVTELTDLYEEDLYVIERMPGVDFISP